MNLGISSAVFPNTALNITEHLGCQMDRMKLDTHWTTWTTTFT